jgi:hypothetical protein
MSTGPVTSTTGCSTSSNAPYPNPPLARYAYVCSPAAYAAQTFTSSRVTCRLADR